jgi:adenylate cyclase
MTDTGGWPSNIPTSAGRLPLPGPADRIEGRTITDSQDVAASAMQAVSKKAGRMLSFRTSITFAVMAFIATLAVLLIVIQFWTFHLAAKETASAHMDAASARTLGRLQDEISEITTLVRVLSTGSSIADSDDRFNARRAIPLFKAALLEVPQMDSIYVGYDNGAWLQVRPLSYLNEEQRGRLRAPADAAFGINLSGPTPNGDLPMRRIFEDRQGNELDEFDLWKYGYDPRQRRWYMNAIQAERTVVSPPYLAFTIGAPVITVSAPLRGRVRGVIAADLKLDDFSDFVNAQRPGEHGTVLVFDQDGMLIAHPDFARLVAEALTHPSHPQLFNIKELGSGLAASILKDWNGGDRFDGSVRDERGAAFLFRLRKFTVGEQSSLNLLMIAREDDFVKDVQKSQVIGLMLAMIVSAAFVPGVWLFGGRMSGSLKAITAQANRLQRLAAPDCASTSSNIKEIYELGLTVNLAQRAIWAFSRFVPKELVRRVVDSSISTELGGVRREITILFTDVRGFTTIAESSNPDILMHQMSRYFTKLTEAFLAEDGTVDKFIGDAVMVFWNAPNSQSDHVERACRAALAGKVASEQLNAQFEAEGLQPFVTRFGVHVGDAVVGNLGSSERMNYTALGSAVNLASRLEGLNKQYGTTILASDAVYRRARGCFRFKEIAAVVAKGMTSETVVYELIGVSP